MLLVRSHPAVCSLLSFTMLASLIAMATAACNVDEEEVTYSHHVHAMPYGRTVARFDPYADDDGNDDDTNPATAKLTYWGGKIVQHPSVVEVLYGQGTYIPQLTSTRAPNMGGFYREAVTSGVYTWLAEYNTDMPEQSFGVGSFAGSVKLTPTAAHDGDTVSDANIQAELATAIRDGSLPELSADRVYMVHLPRGKTIASPDGGKSCVEFCAYHGTFKIGGQDVYYGVLPDMTGACGYGCGPGQNAFDRQTSVAAHELVETMTDAEVGLARRLAKPLAWYDATHGEIADICAGHDGSFVGSDGFTYAVQQMFSNQERRCITTRATAADGVLVSGVPATGLGGAVSSRRLWTVSVPAGRHRLTVSTNGGTGDVDLYVRKGARPTTTHYDCRPHLPGNTETCTFDDPAAADYEVLLRGAGVYTGVTLSVDVD